MTTIGQSLEQLASDRNGEWMYELPTHKLWLQGAYTQRYNGRHKLRGHLFQGRYKAVPVEAADDGTHFGVVSTYIHLNPARAGLIRVGEQRLKRYRWSSYPWYLNRAGRRPRWLEVSRVTEALGLRAGEARGYEAYLEGRVLELGSKAGRKDLDGEWKAETSWPSIGREGDGMNRTNRTNGANVTDAAGRDWRWTASVRGSAMGEEDRQASPSAGRIRKAEDDCRSPRRLVGS